MVQINEERSCSWRERTSTINMSFLHTYKQNTIPHMILVALSAGDPDTLPIFRRMKTWEWSRKFDKKKMLSKTGTTNNENNGETVSKCQWPNEWMTEVQKQFTYTQTQTFDKVNKSKQQKKSLVEKKGMLFRRSYNN